MPRLLQIDGAPTHEHDCKKCVYLGSTKFHLEGEPPTAVVDMYIHLNPSGRHTFIRRYSSTPADYASFRPGDWTKEAQIPNGCRTAMTLAKQKGLI